MVLAFTVTLVVIAATVLLGIVGYVIDRSARRMRRDY